nr:MAG: Replication initiator protein A (RepA) N-terminus [Bacteriophage sp.]
MQTESYVVLRPFMVEELGLKGSELVAYALIYGFSQDGESWFTGSAQYVADWCGTTRRNAINVLQKLTDKGLVEKVRTGQGCAYRACKNITGEKTSLVKKLHRTGEKTSPAGEKTSPVTGEKTSPNNIGDITSNKDSDNARERRHRLGEFGHVLLSDVDEAKLDEQFPGFWRDYITRVDEYCEQSGKRYGNYRLTISKWIGKDQQTGSVKSDASCTAPVGEAYVGAAERSPRERLIKDYMNATGKGGFPSSCCAHYDRCVQNGVPEYVEADRLTKEWVAAGGTERQFPRSRYPWNPRP